MHSYTTQNRINAQVSKQANKYITDTTLLATMNSIGRSASAKIDMMCSQWFVPRTMSRNYDLSSINVVWNMLYLDKPLLDLTSVSVDGTAQTLSNYRRYLANDSHTYSVQQISSSGNWIEDAADDQVITIAGVWGYRDNYSEAWVSSGDTVQDNPLSASATSLTVNDADGTDAYGNLRFDVGATIQIEDEVLFVTAVNTTTNVLTVIRGALGTTAAEHVQTTAINVWYPDMAIRRAATIIAAYNFNNIALFSQGTFDGQFATENVEIPQEALDIISRRKMRIARGV